MAATGQPKFIPAAGTNLLYGTAGGTVATPAGPIRKFDNLPEVKVDQWETTQINAVLVDGTTPDLEKYFAFGKSDNGELGYTIGGDAAVMGTLFGLKGILKGWKVVFADTTTMAFAGGIIGVKFAVGEKDEFTAMITIKVSGAITFTPPSGSARKPVVIQNANVITEAELSAVRQIIDQPESTIPPAIADLLRKLLSSLSKPVEPITEAMAGDASRAAAETPGGRPTAEEPSPVTTAAKPDNAGEKANP